MNDKTWNLGAEIVKPAIGLKESLGNILSELDQKEINAIRDKNHATSGNDRVQANSWYKNLKYRLILYPVWMGTIAFEGKEYQALIDGCSARVDASTKVAKDKKRMFKTFGIIAGIIAVIALICYFLFLR